MYQILKRCLQYSFNMEKKYVKVRNKRLLQDTSDQVVERKLPKVVKKLSKTFFNVPAINLAENLLGKLIVRKVPESNEILKARIVEVECYPGGDDKGSCSYNGR